MKALFDTTALSHRYIVHCLGSTHKVYTVCKKHIKQQVAKHPCNIERCTVLHPKHEGPHNVSDAVPVACLLILTCRCQILWLVLNIMSLFQFLTPVIDHLDIPIDIKLPLASVVVHIPDFAKDRSLSPTLQCSTICFAIYSKRKPGALLPCT